MGLLRQSRFISGGAVGTKEKGDRCEGIVAEYLVQRGHVILARNYRCRYGEIDILSLCSGVLCVVEVKSLSRRWDASDVQYMVSPAKRMRLRRTLAVYLAETGSEKGSGLDSGSVVRSGLGQRAGSRSGNSSGSETGSRSNMDSRGFSFDSIRFDVATVTDGRVEYYIGEC